MHQEHPINNEIVREKLNRYIELHQNFKRNEDEFKDFLLANMKPFNRMIKYKCLIKELKISIPKLNKELEDLKSRQDDQYNIKTIIPKLHTLSQNIPSIIRENFPHPIVKILAENLEVLSGGVGKRQICLKQKIQSLRYPGKCQVFVRLGDTEHYNNKISKLKQEIKKKKKFLSKKEDHMLQDRKLYESETQTLPTFETKKSQYQDEIKQIYKELFDMFQDDNDSKDSFLKKFFKVGGSSVGTGTGAGLIIAGIGIGAEIWAGAEIGAVTLGVVGGPVGVMIGGGIGAVIGLVAALIWVY